MRWLLWPLKLAGLLLLAALISGAWLFRHEILERVGPEVARVRERFREGKAGGHGAGVPGPEALEEATDKVDSLNGWQADSVLLSAAEMAALIERGLPRAARGRLDSITLVLGRDRVTVSALLETKRIPREVLGPLAGALDPWERISAAGTVEGRGPGRAVWQVDALSLRGFTLPEAASRDLVARALPGAPDGAIPLDLPAGIAALRVRPSGVALYRTER